MFHQPSDPSLLDTCGLVKGNKNNFNVGLIISAVARQKQQNDLCDQRSLCTQWIAKSTRFFMRTAKTD